MPPRHPFYGSLTYFSKVTSSFGKGINSVLIPMTLKCLYLSLSSWLLFQTTYLTPQLDPSFTSQTYLLKRQKLMIFHSNPLLKLFSFFATLVNSIKIHLVVSSESKRVIPFFSTLYPIFQQILVTVSSHYSTKLFALHLHCFKNLSSVYYSFLPRK